MKINPAHLKLTVEAPSIPNATYNLRSTSWPLADDFPIVIDKNGKVVSFYRDPVWDLTLWAGKRVILNFNQSGNFDENKFISEKNCELLKQIVAWWMYGPHGERTPQTLRCRFYHIRWIFTACSKHGIIASEISRFPKILDNLREIISRTHSQSLTYILHTLYEQRDLLGFTLLDPIAISRIANNSPPSQNKQTSYIPPRIWKYQISRLREFLDDFLEHKEQIKNCFEDCLQTYSEAARLHEKQLTESLPRKQVLDVTNTKKISVYFPDAEKFSQKIENYGIGNLLEKWVTTDKTENDLEKKITIRSFSKYFSMVGYVGTAYIMNFSLMRISEAWSLRADCLEIENDRSFGDIYILKGVTRKTIKDNDACWPTSPSTSVAVEAMKVVASLRMSCLRARGDAQINKQDEDNPYLALNSSEPWGSCSIKRRDYSSSTRHHPMSYAQVVENYPKLFDQNQLIITQRDLDIARLITPTLDSEIYFIGTIWILAWHQLRRTGSVNMQASGLVSEFSSQYLLKHRTAAMSLYYGQGHSARRLDQDAHKLYIKTMYEIIGKEISRLFTDRFVSAYGQKRKDEILKVVSKSDCNEFSEYAAKGLASWRETLLGGCTKRGACPYGGIENIAHCGGGIEGEHPCPDALYDRNKIDALSKLIHIINIQLRNAPEKSPLQTSLEAQKRAVERVLHVIQAK